MPFRNLLKLCLAFLLLLSTAAEAASSKNKGKGKGKAKPAGKSLYERIGGQPAVQALVQGVLKRAVSDPRTSDYFKGADLEQVGEHLEMQGCVATGGPCKYTGRSMKESHRGMHVTNAAFDATLEHILFTLRELKVPARETGEIMKAYNSMRKDIVELK